MKIENLQNRLEKLAGSGNIPAWLKAVATESEIQEWRDINLHYYGFERLEPVKRFIQGMRRSTRTCLKA